MKYKNCLSGCGSSAACFGSESGCLERHDCALMFAYNNNNNTNADNNNDISFYMEGRFVGFNSYIAMAISTDGEMGSDLVISLSTLILKIVN